MFIDWFWPAITYIELQDIITLPFFALPLIWTIAAIKFCYHRMPTELNSRISVFGLSLFLLKLKTETENTVAK